METYSRSYLMEVVETQRNTFQKVKDYIQELMYDILLHII